MLAGRKLESCRESSNISTTEEMVVVEKQKMVEQTLGLNLGELGDKPGEKLSAGEVERLRSLLPEGLLPEGDLTQLEVKYF